ncbi:MAG: aspartate carbamoyltransferase [Candidatus Bipolaricaulota bacterium]
MRLAAKDVLKAEQFTIDEIEGICEKAATYEAALASGQPLGILRGKVLATLFFEPSTRTRLSFETAMLRLGGSVVSVADARSTSAAKGETLQDTIRTVEGYADGIVVRHPDVGSAEVAARATRRPVLNAGDGAGEHPTQSLLDVYTLRKEQGRVEGLSIALVGDLRHGRTVHSLATLLANYRVSIVLVSPAALRMPEDVVRRVRARGVEVAETETLEKAVSSCDVIYMTRIQKERFSDPAEAERLQDAYILTRAGLRTAKPSITVMHPLPRVHEIATDVDEHPGAAYFRQSANGVPVRMALLSMLLAPASD